MKILIELIFFSKSLCQRECWELHLSLGGKHNLLTDGFADEWRDLGIK